MWWRSAGEPEGSGKAWTYPGAGAHTNTRARSHKHTAAKAGSSKSYTPLGEARTHTGAGSQEEGAASASLIKTVAVHLSLLLTALTRGAVKQEKKKREKKKQEIWCVTNKHAVAVGVFEEGAQKVCKVEKEGGEWATGKKDVVRTACWDQSVNHNCAFITLVKQTKTRMR